jgi:hypothetical protein
LGFWLRMWAISSRKNINTALLMISTPVTITTQKTLLAWNVISFLLYLESYTAFQVLFRCPFKSDFPAITALGLTLITPLCLYP